ncbi:MAG: hypothetical protein ACOC8P_00490 [Dichotomicrobium sp.]
MAYGKDFLGPNDARYGTDLSPQDVEPPAELFEQPVDISRAVPWRDTERRGLSVAISHGLGAWLSRDLEARHGQGEPEERPQGITWGLLQPRETHRATGWRQTDPLERSLGVRWRNLTPHEISRGAGWRDTELVENSITGRWRLPGTVDVITRVPWGRLVVRDVVRELRWPLGRTHDSRHRIPWGFAKPPRTLVPNPTINRPVPPTPEPDPVYVPPPGDQVALPFECPAFQGQGNEVALPFRKYQCLRRQHVVENDVILKRLDTDETVDCLELSINGDLESYTNGWDATLRRDALSIVEPLDGPVEVVATINGQDHLLLLERWGEDIIFDDVRGRVDTIRVQGRSISAELDEPYSARKSRFEETSKTMWQLMQQELPAEWTLEAHPAWSDYSANTTTAVPAGTFSYTDLSPIQAIARIAAATGAVVQQVPASRTLKIVPRYVAKPWDWGTTTADLEIEFGQVRSASGEFEPQPVHNGVYVAGETNGVLVENRRDGTAGSPWLDIVVDQLITDGQFGLQRGIAELGATGKRSVYQFELPVDGDNEGLIQTGQIANVIETANTDWNGQSVGWSINATRSEDRGLEIWQTVTVERYRDE